MMHTRWFNIILKQTKNTQGNPKYIKTNLDTHRNFYTGTHIQTYTHFPMPGHLHACVFDTQTHPHINTPKEPQHPSIMLDPFYIFHSPFIPFTLWSPPFYCFSFPLLSHLFHPYLIPHILSTPLIYHSSSFSPFSYSSPSNNPHLHCRALGSAGCPNSWVLGCCQFHCPSRL